MKTLIIILMVALLASGCQNKMTNETIVFTEDNLATTPSAAETDPPAAQIKITAKGREYAIEEIQQGILKAFQTELYYAGNDGLHLNRDLILGKTLIYDLVFVDDQYLPYVLMIVNNLEHPLSTAEEPLYRFGIAFSEQGMEEKFYTFGTASEKELNYMTKSRGEVYLGSYSLHISEIIKPQHELMSEEWKRQAETAIQQYMDKNDFYSEKEKNLAPGKYHVYIKGFSKGDVDTVIIFEHENGNVYQGDYYFVHDISAESSANLNHVELIEDPSESYAQWLDKVRESAAINMEYYVQPVSESGKDTSQTEEETPPLSEEPTGKDEQNNMVEGTLIVNGKQIDSQFTCVDSESLNVHFSLTAVLEAVGAKVQQNGAEFVITYGDNSTTINTEDPLWEFPIPPGATNCVREIIAGELVIDSISVEGFLKNFLCADIEVQYSTATVMINQN